MGSEMCIRDRWYTDSDALNDLVPFRTEMFADALARVHALQSFAVRNAGRVPSWIIKKYVMGPQTRAPRGTMHAIETGHEEGIRAHFGSREAWEAIGGWDDFVVPNPSRTPAYLDHGYDESKPETAWTHADLVGAATFRGGSPVTPPATSRTPTTWRCADGHTFEASPFLVLRGGHWCPTCVQRSGDYDRQAETNAFLAQVLVG